MKAHRKLQKETMTTYGEIIDLLDKVVAINSERTGRRHGFTESQILQRRNQEEYRGYYLYVASFIAQRACHTAQANALLLRHGFQDQAFELWRTLVNLHEQLESMIGDEQEKEAEIFLSAAAAEMIFLDKQAKEGGSGLGKMFDDTNEDSIREIATRMEVEYGQGILKRDGWKNPNPTATECTIGKKLKAEMDHHYRLASKLQHGTPISTAIGADFEMRPLRNPLEHKTGGVAIQCMWTAFMLHSIVTMFRGTTEEKKDSRDEFLMQGSIWALREMSKFHSP